MLAASDIRLTEETLQDLRRQGQDERARALEAVLAAATASLGLDRPVEPREYLTTGQAARALGVSLQTIKNWVAAGHLQATRLGSRTLVHREALLLCVEQLRAGRPARRPSTADDAAIAAERRRFILGGLPEIKVSQLEALHERMEAGQRLSRAEHAELTALEQELMELAGERLDDWSRQSRLASR